MSIYTTLSPISIKHHSGITNCRAALTLYPFVRKINSTPFYNVCSLQSVSTVKRCSFFVLFLNKDASFAENPRAPPVFLLMKIFDFLEEYKLEEKEIYQLPAEGKMVEVTEEHIENFISISVRKSI